MTVDLPCRDVTTRATDYLEDALPFPDRARLEAHLVLCPGCRHFIAQIRDTARVLNLLPKFDRLPSSPSPGQPAHPRRH